jgi:hypothetical protein
MNSKIKENDLWDVVVIGGGPAGMMAAGRASARGLSVLLLEKNPTLGKKLLLAGGGRCNLTNNISDIRLLAAKYKESGKFLLSAFSQFGVSETLDFFHSWGLETKEEDEGRIFPVSNQAQSVLDIFIKYMKKSGVEVEINAEVGDVTVGAKNKHFNIRIKDGKEIKAKSCIIATGGAALPVTGSTGDGFGWLGQLGHTVCETGSALVPISLKDAWVKKLSGIILEDIKLTIFQNGKKYGSERGKMLFAHFGITGPMVLNMSSQVGELMKNAGVTIALDLFPAFDAIALKKKFQELFAAESNKKLKNTLSLFVPLALSEAILEMAHIDSEVFNNSLKSEDRTKLLALVKNIPLTVDGLLGLDKAIASSGGIDPREVDFKTMQSRIVPRLYIIGDALDMDRASGGYSLQICWTTGFVAGENC